MTVYVATIDGDEVKLYSVGALRVWVLERSVRRAAEKLIRRSAWAIGCRAVRRVDGR